MKKFCVIGDRVETSASPRIHNAAMMHEDIEGIFEAVTLQPDELKQWVTDTFRSSYTGAAVTIPHKESIIPLLDFITPAAQSVGAVNTLFWEGEKLGGTNTDTIGILKALENHTNLKDKSVLILGAGGAARAVAYTMSLAGASFSLWNRTIERAETLVDIFSGEIIPSLDDIHGHDFDIVINTTSVGMGSFESLLPSRFWEAHHIAFDIVYKPLETKFLYDAAQSGATTITGDTMLIEQARAQFEIWHGQPIDSDIMSIAFFDKDE